MSGFCGQCGAAKATADQRFCQGCGAGFTSPGAPPDATPAAAPFTPPPPPTAAAALPQAFGPPAPVDYAVPARLPERSGGPSVGRILGIGAAVLALAAGGLVAWQVLGPSGGAATPEDAVRQFVTAAADQDVVGALKVVNPGEVEGLDSLYTAARSRAEEESLVQGEGAVTDALTVALTDLDLDVEELSEGAAYVTLRDGDYTVRYDPGQLPDRFDFIAPPIPRRRSGRATSARSSARRCTWTTSRG